MKICQINCVYAVGSTGKITKDLHERLLEMEYESIVVFSGGVYDKQDTHLFCTSNRFLNIVSAIYRRLTGRQYDGAFLQTNKILSILKRQKPDVVHLQCINGNNINNYRLLKYLAKNKINTVLTLHAEFMYTGGCGHAFDCNKWLTGCHDCSVHKIATQCYIDGTRRTWLKRKKCYNLFDKNKLIVTAVSPWLADRAKRSMLNRFDIRIVMNGVNTNIFKYIGYDTEVLKKYGLPLDKKIVFFPTAIFNPDNKTDLKGGRYVLELAKLLNKDTVVVVAANYGSASILPDNVYYIGRTENQEDLAKLYNCAEVTIVLSLRETFSMPTAESLCCGTPVVGFKCGGAESIAISKYTDFCEYGNIDKILEKIETLNYSDKDRCEVSCCAGKIYNSDNSTDSYRRIYKFFKSEKVV